jgi:hypothetical protein
VRPEPPLAELSNSVDEIAVTRYLDTIDEQIGQIAKEYSQLADWNVPKGPAWSDSGKSRTAGRLEYAHGRLSQRPATSVDRFGADGFELEVRVIPQRTMRLLAGPSIGTFVFGAPLGGGCVIAGLRSADPARLQNSRLALRVMAIVKEPLGSFSGSSCLP